MQLPVRKCYHAAKVGLFLILVVTVLSLFEQWRGGKRSAKAQTLEEDEYERQILEDEARIIPGLGEGGIAARLHGKDKLLGEESEKKLAMNVYLSDRIAYNRTLKDHRNPACARVVYDAELPSASVVLIFHNEPYSVVVRTVWSVVNSARRDRPWLRRANYVDRDGRTMTLGSPGQDPASPLVYLKEIILVDDNSTLPELKGKLSHYVRTRLPPDLIRIVRMPERVGLIRSRMAGARYAAGDVLVFLDAHCEAQEDWLRPILQRIKEAPHAVVVPIIDAIESSTFYYSVMDPRTFQGLMRARMRGARAARGDVLVFLDAHCEAGSDWLRPLLQRLRHKRDAVLTPLIDVVDQTSFELEASPTFQVGGFSFMGHFTWIDVPEREKKRRGSDIAPTWSPTMAGGLFAINRQYYWELGAYDEQMAGWGGENLEMSFRIWQCGGTLETIPCSRVGHVFRSFHPYGMPANSDTHGINTARMADVWMDDYAELFYLHRPDLRKSPKVGDVTHRRVLREKLHCKSFKWYLDTVYREKFVPVRDVFGYGRFSNPSSGLCLDTLQREGDAVALGVYSCHARLEPTQHLALSLAGELRDEERCAELQHARRPPEEAGSDVSRRVLMTSCHGKQRGQKWRYLPSSQLQHEESGLCLTAGGRAGDDAAAGPCRAAPGQLWTIDYSERNDFHQSDDSIPTDQEERLKRLRGQRRISRSLLSYPEEKAASQRRSHRRKHKKHKSRKKNKFILKLVRRVNGSEQHLELDAYCRHRRLFPNDSFVRDLVAILNQRDIKVINNGRVFEKNRVRAPDHREQTPEHVSERASEHDHEQTPEHAPEHLPEQNSIFPAASNAEIIKTRTKSQTKKRRHEKKTPEPESEPEDPSPDAPDAADVPEERKVGELTSPHEKRIIIEDFVEIKPLTPTTQRPQKKRKRRRRTTAAVTTPTTTSTTTTTTTTINPPEWEESMRVEAGSLEDAPLAASAEDRREERHEERASGETWPIQVSYFRHSAHTAPPAARADRDEQADGGDGGGGSGGDGDRHPPVKLVMRSNLTFNLGDELFRWRERTRAADDVASLLSDLVMPGNSSRRPPPGSEELPSGKTGRGEDSSGSSDSSE